jgi:hypothetical protein
LGALDEPSKIGTIIRKGLAEAEPTAYAIMKALALTEEQVDRLEEAINAAGDPLEGTRQWAKDNPEWCGPGSRGRRASIARVLASLSRCSVGAGTAAPVGILTMVRPSTFDFLSDHLS